MYSVKENGGYSVVHLTGEVDLNCSPEARKVILDCLRSNTPLLIDLSAVTYIDSSGIASLVEGYQVSRTLNLEFGLVGVSNRAMSVLRLARLDQVFPIFASVEDRLKRDPPREG